MNDRELLKLAAKAAGIFGEWVENSTEGEYYKLPTSGIKLTSEGRTHVWNPLTSSGDALRLAVKLGIELVFTFNKIGARRHADTYYLAWANEDRKVEDPYAAARLAIVRAAAEIGRNMK